MIDTPIGAVTKLNSPVDLCAPTPGKNGWPTTSMLAPATMYDPNWVAPSPAESSKRGLLPAIGMIAGALFLLIIVFFLRSKGRKEVTES